MECARRISVPQLHAAAVLPELSLQLVEFLLCIQAEGEGPCE